MATFLYRLGRFSFRRRRLVALVWLGVLVAVGAAGATLSGPTSAAFSIPGTESQKAIDLLQERFPQASAAGATARVVFAAPAGQKLTDSANKAAVEAVVADLKAGPQVASVTNPFTTGTINPAGTVAFTQAVYTVTADNMNPAARAALTSSLDAGRAAGLTVEMGGDAAQAPAAQGLGEVLGIVAAAFVLLITFGSLVAAGLPLLTAIVGITISVSAITAATGFVAMNSSNSTLALMLGLAVSIDYALFIVSRYRHELSLGLDAEEAAGRALGTAGSAVAFAGLTVVIALAALSVVGLPILTQMGLAAAFAVVIAVLIALTLLPALLGFAGRRIVGKGIRGLRTRQPEITDAQPTAGARWVRFVTRRPVSVLIVAVLGLLVVAIPATTMRLGLPDDGAQPPDSTQHKAYDLLTDGFGAGFNGPLTIVVDAAACPAPRSAAATVATDISTLPDVVAVSPAAFNKAGDTAILTVIPRSAPSSVATEQLVTAIRDQADQVRTATKANVAVTGQTAIDIDISNKLGSALVPYLAVIIGLAFILLTLVFRSILVPLKATLGFLLSVAATFGAVVAVFQWGWLSALFGISQTAPIVSLLPVFLVGVVFGLAMDYEIFLVTRMREEYVHGAPSRLAVTAGFTHGARVVTAAAIVMVGVFSGFMLSDQAFVKSIGFALAAAIVFDAFVVRMTIVPAVMVLLGRRAWWIPRWLDRVLPNVDVEGERLRTRAPEALDPVEREPQAARH
jgi:RND superfamily putative drug exporter